MSIRQLSVFVENQKGALAGVLHTISSAGIELRALSIADTSDFGILRVITSDNTRAALALSESGAVCSVTDVVAASADDKPGGLAALLTILSEAGIDVEYVYAFVSRTSGSAYVVIRVADNDATVEILKNNGITVAAPEEVYTI